MLEAVNSVLSNASYTKAIADQQSVVNSYAANPSRVQQASTQAPYLSLYIKVDTDFDRALLQIRDNETGDVLRQIPSESQLEAYRRAQTSNAVRPATVQEEKAQDTTAETPEIKLSTPTPAPETPDVPKAETPAPPPASIDTEV
jgi:hypothetical protein